MTPALHAGADSSGNLTCPSCDKPRTAGRYLCPGCWFALPNPARTSLNKRDRLALTRLKELLHQLRDHVHVTNIEVSP